MGKGERMTEAAREPSVDDRAALRRDREVVIEQFAAANEVLIALGRSSVDPDAVLHTVIESAARLPVGPRA